MKKKQRPLRATRTTCEQSPREMDKVAIGWMINYAMANKWRVEPLYDLDDLIQEGHLWWREILRRYPTAKTPSHLMSLFKLAYHHHITNLANKRTKEKTVTSFFELEPNVLELEGATFHLLTKQAPQKVRAVLELFTSEEGLKRLRRCRHLRRPNGTRETANEFLRRMTKVYWEDALPDETPLGFWSDRLVPADLAGALQDHFSPS